MSLTIKVTWQGQCVVENLTRSNFCYRHPTLSDIRSLDVNVTTHSDEGSDGMLHHSFRCCYGKMTIEIVDRYTGKNVHKYVLKNVFINLFY